MKLLATIYYYIDTFFYKVFGYVSPTRRAYWHREALKIQYLLDKEHGTLEGNVL